MCDARCMRTTLDIDPVLLAYAKGYAKHKKMTVGEVISNLANKGLTSGPPAKITYKSGIPQISRGADSDIVITSEFVKALLEETE